MDKKKYNINELNKKIKEVEIELDDILSRNNSIRCKNCGKKIEKLPTRLYAYLIKIKIDPKGRKPIFPQNNNYYNEDFNDNRNMSNKLSFKKIYINISRYPETKKFPFLFCSEKCKYEWMFKDD